MTEHKTATCTNCLNGRVPLEEYLIFDHMCVTCFCAWMWQMLEAEEKEKEYIGE